MTIAFDLLQLHIQTLVKDNARWQTLIADDLLWELVYAPSIGHPARLSGRGEVVHHVTWFLGAVENFRFFDLRVYPLADRLSCRGLGRITEDNRKGGERASGSLQGCFSSKGCGRAHKS